MALVRNAVIEDLECINSILSINNQISDITRDDIAECVVAEVDGKVVGCGMGREHKDNLELRKVSVLPEYQGLGIGKTISRTLLKRAQTKRCWLLSTDSRVFWEKLGFHGVSEKEEPKEAEEYCVKCGQRGKCDRVVMFREMG
jgi:N-acetylglutamate synthase-like GNAT family acetyltransferase